MTTPSPPAPSASPERILHVAHQAPPHIGGLESVVANETQGLIARDWNVALACAAGESTPGLRDEDGVRTLRMRAWNGLEDRFGVPFPFFGPFALWRLRREVRRVDVVHIHDVIYLSSWAAALWCVLSGTPFVVHRHVGVVHHPSLLVRVLQDAVLGSLGRAVLAAASVVVAIDEPIAAAVRTTIADPAKVSVLPNGVDAERFRPAESDADRRRLRTSRGLPHDRILGLFVGRFVPKKGFDVVLSAVGDDYDLVFAGGDRPAVAHDARLHFLGGVPAAEMPEIYRCVDVMVIASVGECPLTVLESMSSGLPLLVNDDPALRSPWTTGPGVRFLDLAGPGAGTRLGDALADLARDDDLRRRAGVEARAFVATSFSWEVHLDQLEAIYRELLTPSGSGSVKNTGRTRPWRRAAA